MIERLVVILPFLLRGIFLLQLLIDIIDLKIIGYLLEGARSKGFPMSYSLSKVDLFSLFQLGKTLPDLQYPPGVHDDFFDLDRIRDELIFWVKSLSIVMEVLCVFDQIIGNNSICLAFILYKLFLY